MKIVIPTNCPSCGSTLETVNGQLFCRNKSCSAQSSKIVEGFCKKMKIKGFGAKTIEKLELQTIGDLYNLDEHIIRDALSDTMARKLMNEIDKSLEDCDFGTFLGALGINLIGTVAAQKVAKKCNRLVDITYNICKDAGLGDKATESLLNYLASPEGEEVIDTVDLYIMFASPKPTQVSASAKPMQNIDVCITGKLNDFPNRTKAAGYLEPYGITVKKSVTKSCKYLICEDDTKVGSSSYKKALDNGIQILTIKELINTIGENL